jgi:esterase/lipase superfamily enzyme
MTASNLSDRPLAQLLSDLQDAVRDCDVEEAQRLEHQILQLLTRQAAESAAIEQEVKALMAQVYARMARLMMRSAEISNSEETVFSERDRDELLKELDPLSRFFDVIFGVKDKWVAPPAPPAPARSAVVPVWYATNRTQEGGGYCNGRSAATTYGRALVQVPEAHRFGETGSSFWQRFKRFDLRDDRLRLQAFEPREQERFFSEIRAEMDTARQDGATPHALVFIHGFNVSFEEAAIRSAQLAVDLKVSGATAFFSWPSRGTISAYTADEATIEASEGAISRFLIDFSAQCGAQKVHLIAHSMGNRGLLRALQRIAADAQAHSSLRFGQIFLAAPDVDRDLFLDLARLYPQFAQRTTLYASAADRAVHLSARLHDAPRAGYFFPYTVASGVDTVAVPNFDLDLIGHGYYAEAEALLHDIFYLMRRDAPPSGRQRLIAAEADGLHFWRFNR